MRKRNSAKLEISQFFSPTIIRATALKRIPCIKQRKFNMTLFYKMMIEMSQIVLN